MSWYMHSVKILKLQSDEILSRPAKVHCGSIISAPMLVADEKSRDALMRNYPSKAIGGEIEWGVPGNPE